MKPEILHASILVLGLLLGWVVLGRPLRDAYRLVRLGSPARVHLTREEEPRWLRPGAVAEAAAALRELHFEEVGGFRVEEMPGVRLLALLHERDGACAVVYDHPIGGNWVDLVVRYETGGTLTVTNAPQGGEVDAKPGHGKIFEPAMKPAELYALLGRRREQKPVHRITIESFAREFEDAYAQEMDWRNVRGAR